MNTRVVGLFGESQARDYVKNLGYKILKSNYVCKVGEIDIIAQDNKTIVFIEVKKRETEKFGRPSEAVNVHKQQKIRRVAECYIQINKLYNSFVRFDVIEILDNDINYIINAF